MKTIYIVFLVLSLVTLARCQGSLLEMSQGLWAKLLAGGLAKVGKLDPLRVPVVKVDQSEGDTSYRMILRNVEISGLNNSTLESIHIARGRLKSNLSELEAGYVSYSDLRDLDAIRYRFHTLIKEPKTQNESFEAIVSATNQENKFRADSVGQSSSYQESRLERFRQYDPFLLKLQEEQMKQDHSKTEQNSRNDQRTHSADSTYGTFSMEGARVHSNSESTHISVNSGRPFDDQPKYFHSSTNSGTRRNDEHREHEDCYGNSCARRSGSRTTADDDYRSGGRRGEFFDQRQSRERLDDVQGSASEHVETTVRSQDHGIGAGVFGRSEIHRESTESRSSSRIEKQPSYIDIVYADGKNNGSVKRFGNARIDSGQNAKVYSLEDVMKDIRENRRFIIHNFTEGESLTKRNDAIRTAIEAKRLKDLIRYAKNYQEKEGYFEEGMQLVYHYGGMNTSRGAQAAGQVRRHKRAHNHNETEEDVMHVILRIRVPVLRVKSEYQLMGKVGKELLRGNGQLEGNFTELIGDFTLELKKVSPDMMIVRAARSKLIAKDQKIDLQGIDEKGPVASILSHGLMAAEAVAAMLADDLATKALSEKTADAMIYRMYKNLPVN